MVTLTIPKQHYYERSFEIITILQKEDYLKKNERLTFSITNKVIANT